MSPPPPSHRYHASITNGLLLTHSLSLFSCCSDPAPLPFPPSLLTVLPRAAGRPLWSPPGLHTCSLCPLPAIHPVHFSHPDNPHWHLSPLVLVTTPISARAVPRTCVGVPGSRAGSPVHVASWDRTNPGQTLRTWCMSAGIPLSPPTTP